MQPSTSMRNENRSNSSNMYEIMIFSKEFLEHNRNQQSQYIALRKCLLDYEEQNADLKHNNDVICETISKIENDICVKQYEKQYLTHVARKIHSKFNQALSKNRDKESIKLSSIEDPSTFIETLNDLLAGKNEKIVEILSNLSNEIDFRDIDDGL